MAKGPPPHCETLAHPKKVSGTLLPAGTELCRQQGDRDWSWASLPSPSLVFPGISLEPGAQGKISFSKVLENRKRIEVSGKLAKDAVIFGVPFRSGTEVEFYLSLGDRTLHPLRGTLERKHSWYGWEFPPGTVLEWSRESITPDQLRLAILPAVSLIGGRKLQGNILFFGNGEEESLSLAENAPIDGVPCMGSTDRRKTSGGLIDVSFYPSGKLKSCVLSQTYEKSSLTFPKNSRLDFYESGELRAFLLPRSPEWNTITVAGVKCDTSSHGFHASMVPEPMVKAYASPTNGVQTQFNVLLFKNGRVAYCDIDEDQSFSGIPLSSRASGFVGIAFYESGKLRRGHVAKELTISKVRLPAESGIELYESGALKAVEDHDGLTVAGVQYPWGQLIQFREDGSVRKEK